MDVQAIDHTPLISEMIQVPRAGAVWPDEPFRGHWFATHSIDDMRTSSEERSATRRMLDIHAPTQTPIRGEPDSETSTPLTVHVPRDKPQPVSAGQLLTAHTVSQRTKLLAMKYAAENPTPELMARLAILDARLGRLVPRISSSVIEAVAIERDRVGVASQQLDELLASF